MDRRNLLYLLTGIIFVISLIIFIYSAIFSLAAINIIIASLILAIISAIMLYLIQEIAGVSQSPLTVIDSITELNIINSSGKIAMVKKTQRFKANSDNIVKMLDEGVWADGIIEVIEAKCEPLKVSIDPHIIKPGDKGQLEFTFHEKPIRNNTYTRVIEYNFKDSFLKAEENFSIKITRPIRSIRVIINFPRERPIQNTWLRYQDEKTIVDFEYSRINIELDKGIATKAVYFAVNPKVGSIHQVCWIW